MGKPLSQKESLSIKHAAPLQEEEEEDAGLQGLQLVDSWSSRPGEPFAGLPKCFEGAGQKEVSCVGFRGRVLGAGDARGGGSLCPPPTAAPPWVAA